MISEKRQDQEIETGKEEKAMCEVATSSLDSLRGKKPPGIALIGLFDSSPQDS